MTATPKDDLSNRKHTEINIVSRNEKEYCLHSKPLIKTLIKPLRFSKTYLKPPNVNVLNFIFSQILTFKINIITYIRSSFLTDREEIQDHLNVLRQLKH